MYIFLFQKMTTKFPWGRLEVIAPTTFWPWGRLPPWTRRLWFGGLICIGTFSVFWQLQLINLGLSSIALSNYIQYTPQLSVLFTVHTIVSLKPIRIAIADLIGGTKGVSSWVTLRLGTFGCRNRGLLIFTVKNMLKFENF